MTLSSSTPLDQQLLALADLSMPYDHQAESLRRFDPSLAEHDAASGFGVRLVMGFLPAILVLVAAGFIMRFPIDKRRHDIIRKRLERLAARRAREQTMEELPVLKEAPGEIAMRPSATR